MNATTVCAPIVTVAQILYKPSVMSLGSRCLYQRWRTMLPILLTDEAILLCSHWCPWCTRFLMLSRRLVGQSDIWWFVPRPSCTWERDWRLFPRFWSIATNFVNFVPEELQFMVYNDFVAQILLTVIRQFWLICTTDMHIVWGRCVCVVHATGLVQLSSCVVQCLLFW